MPLPEGPALTVDVIVELDDGRIVLIRRRNPPHGWALPGGFVDRGETVEEAAAREAEEEIGLTVRGLRQLHVYSDPDRDPRGHTVSVVFVGRADGEPRADTDAAEAVAFPVDELPDGLVFDHDRILADYRRRKRDDGPSG